jgi:ABC-type spermidine/putrescine transport system permease subunit II
MKKSFLFTLSLSLLPLWAYAQKIDDSIFNDEFAYASVFAGNFSLLISIVIGAIATYLVFRAAKRLGGGLFGLVLNYIGIGMLLIVVGTISSISNPWFTSFWSNVISTAAFATGYIFMVIGANRLFKGIMSA